MSKIRLLSDDLINQIAAGEIVEQPASALKELVENSIDANAKNIDIFLQNGGKSKIVVQDDGEGMDRSDLLVAVQRHATSKLRDDNLFDIRSYGFRGEALPSIASVSNFTIESRSFGVSINFSEQSDVFPSIVESGTRVTVQSLFAKTPARLKFLKSDTVELTACINVIENISLIWPDINISLRTEDKQIIAFQNDSIESRISRIMGVDIFKRSIKFEEKAEHISVSGYLFHPMDNRYSQSFQRIFINGRIVRDKTVSFAIRNAYKELIPAGRFAIAVIFIEIDPFHLDANVSPTKSEVRFRDPRSVQKFLTEAFKKNLLKFDRVTNEVDLGTLTKQDLSQHMVAMESEQDRHITERVVHMINPLPPTTNVQNISSFKKCREIKQNIHDDPPLPISDGMLAVDFQQIEQQLPHVDDMETSFFGEPIAQVFNAYIITETENGLMIIDQHAVHEKITQDKMLRNISTNNKQFLMKPEIIELSQSEIEVATMILDKLNDCGFVIEVIQNSIMISAIPAILNPAVAVQFIRDILASHDTIDDLEVLDVIRKKIADKACHNSIRFGRKLSHDEMIATIKQMEETPSIHQCNHHRPSFIEISKDQLEKMFNRS